MFLAYATRAYPANKQVLTELLQVRQEIASTLGYKTWADLSIADKMMGSVGRLSVFLQELDEVSKAGAAKEYAMVLANAQKQQPGLTKIDMAGSLLLGRTIPPRCIRFRLTVRAPVFSIRARAARRARYRFKTVPCRIQAGAWCRNVGPIRDSLGRDRPGQARRPLLPRHASARRQRQVVL